MHALLLLTVWLGCTDADIRAPGDAAPGEDSGADAAARDAAADGSVDASPPDAGAGCAQFVEVTCPPAGCPPPDAVRVDLSPVATLVDPVVAGAESVAFVPGDRPRAVALSIDRRLALLEYDATRVTLVDSIDIAAPAGEFRFSTAVAVHPSGDYAAVTIADATCGPGQVAFLSLDPFGDELHRVDVGFAPDSLAFSPDGSLLVTADEDPRTGRPCKPAGRLGGSITIVQLGSTAADATVVQTLATDHDDDAEPEHVAIAADGTVVVTLQDSGELAVFDLDDVPTASHRIISLTPGSDPDGVAIDRDLGLAVVGYERFDAVVLVDLTTDVVVHERFLTAAGDVPAEYNRDARDSVEIHEPENVARFEWLGARFVVTALQESHALVAYRLAAAPALTLDSIAPVGRDYLAEAGGRTRSSIRPEGVSVRASHGLFLVASSEEGSVTLLRSAQSATEPCD